MTRGLQSYPTWEVTSGGRGVPPCLPPSPNYHTPRAHTRPHTHTHHAHIHTPLHPPAHTTHSPRRPDDGSRASVTALAVFSELVNNKGQRVSAPPAQQQQPVQPPMAQYTPPATPQHAGTPSTAGSTPMVAGGQRGRKGQQGGVQWRVKRGNPFTGAAYFLPLMTAAAAAACEARKRDKRRSDPRLAGAFALSGARTTFSPSPHQPSPTSPPAFPCIIPPAFFPPAFPPSPLPADWPQFQPLGQAPPLAQPAAQHSDEEYARRLQAQYDAGAGWPPASLGWGLISPAMLWFGQVATPCLCAHALSTARLRQPCIGATYPVHTCAACPAPAQPRQCAPPPLRAAACRDGRAGGCFRGPSPASRAQRGGLPSDCAHAGRPSAHSRGGRAPAAPVPLALPRCGCAQLPAGCPAAAGAHVAVWGWEGRTVMQ